MATMGGTSCQQRKKRSGLQRRRRSVRRGSRRASQQRSARPHARLQREKLGRPHGQRKSNNKLRSTKRKRRQRSMTAPPFCFRRRLNAAINPDRRAAAERQKVFGRRTLRAKKSKVRKQRKRADTVQILSRPVQAHQALFQAAHGASIPNAGCRRRSPRRMPRQTAHSTKPLKSKEYRGEPGGLRAIGAPVPACCFVERAALSEPVEPVGSARTTPAHAKFFGDHFFEQREDASNREVRHAIACGRAMSSGSGSSCTFRRDEFDVAIADRHSPSAVSIFKNPMRRIFAHTHARGLVRRDMAMVHLVR